jgi:hypothetical protein
MLVLISEQAKMRAGSNITSGTPTSPEKHLDCEAVGNLALVAAWKPSLPPRIRTVILSLEGKSPVFVLISEHQRLYAKPSWRLCVGRQQR